MIFTVKPDGRHKARLVLGGHQVDSSCYDTYASMVKSLSVCLLELIASANHLTTLVGDVRNAFINAVTKEKVYCAYCIAGPEFRFLGKEGCILIVHRLLYGLKTSAERWHSTRFDRGIWIHDRGDGYDYICTHVDDFKISAKDPHTWMAKLQEVFQIKDPGCGTIG